MVHDLGAATVTQVVAAARGLCEVVFLADRALPHVADQFALMEQLANVLDVTDMPIDRIRNLVRALDPAGVLTFSGHQVDRAAELARECGLVGHDPETARALTDKLRQRAVLAEHGVQSTACASVQGQRDVPGAVEITGLPAVLKPRQGAGSVDVRRVDSPEDCLTAVAELDVGPERPFVLEEMLRGVGTSNGLFADYVSVESVVQHGRIHTVGLTDKFPMVEPFREAGHVWPSTLEDAEAARVTALTERTLTALGVRDGVCHTEVKLTPAGPRVIEVNGRLGGGVGELARRGSGVDLARIAILIALGQPISVPEPATDGLVYQMFLLPPYDCREVVSVAPLRKLADLPAVTWVELRADDGDRVDWRRGAEHRMAVAHGTVDHAEDLRPVITAAEAATREACR